MFFKVQFNSPHFIVEEKVWGGGQDPFGVCMQYESAVYRANKKRYQQCKLNLQFSEPLLVTFSLNLESHKESGTR